ncbi:hypothetical protein KJ633_05635 [bacterium]|nr:hypothetical protein [bacterium]MBU3955924.1 hypothetical protein [bacterium]
MIDMKKIIIVAVSCVLATALYAAEIVPVGEINLSGGASFYEGESSASGGNFNIAAVPAVKFSENVVLLPGYYGNYRGSKSVYELIGGGTLYQDSMSHNFTLRLINKLSPDHKFKLKTGYVFNYFRETTDEDWGEGLFDFEKFTVGAESEVKNFMGMDKFISSFDIMKVQFPEYESLASALYGTEVFPGGRILDFNGLNVYFRGLKKLNAKSIVDVNLNFMLKDFPDQNVIDSLGDYTLTKRADRTSALDMVYSRILGSFSAGLSLSGSVNRSNQDHYDADEYKFVDKYYDYNSYSVGPVVSFGNNFQISCAYKYGIKNYEGRLVQQNTPLVPSTHGDYTNQKVKNKTHFVSLGSSYKLSKHLKAKLSANYFAQDSNQDYEAVYQYSYDTYNFDAGVVYEF